MTLTSKTATEIEVSFPYGNVGLVLIEASKLTESDDFMMYEPENPKEKSFMNLVTHAIERDIQDLWGFKQNPFLNDTGNGICFKRNGVFPSVSFEIWEKMAKNALPEMESDIATKSQFVAIHAILLKKLVEAGVYKEDAWRMVCINHIELLKYLNSHEARSNPVLAGIMDVNLFYNLLSMKVLLKYEEDDGRWERDNFYSDYADAYGLFNCNLKNAYWIAGASKGIGGKYSIADFDICSIRDKTIPKSIGLVVCNLV